jgi:DNA-binding transcriptional LysR family regulator
VGKRVIETALGYFYEAATLGSMRLASDKIGVAVSSISRQIAQLELQLGSPLIERRRRSIRLTQAGQIALDYHRQQLADRELLLLRLRELREVKTGQVDIAVGEGFLGRPFSALIDGFQRRNPGVVISVTAGSTAEIVRMVLEDEAHFGLIFGTSGEPKIRTRSTIAQPLMVLCASNHAAARLGSLTLGDLTSFDLCLPPRGFRMRHLIEDVERREQIVLEPKIVSSSLHVMRELVRQGRMVAILPRIAAIAELEDGSCVALPLAETELEVATVSLIHRLGRHLEGAPIRLLAQIEAKLQTWANPPSDNS